MATSNNPLAELRKIIKDSSSAEDCVVQVKEWVQKYTEELHVECEIQESRMGFGAEYERIMNATKAANKHQLTNRIVQKAPFVERIMDDPKHHRTVLRTSVLILTNGPKND